MIFHISSPFKKKVNTVWLVGYLGALDWEEK
jgi:hypothetical protein